MSSMFKKKGGLAFKPKAPSARPRHAASIPPAQASKASEKLVTNDTVADTPSQESSATPAPPAVISDHSPADSHDAIPPPPRAPSPTPPAITSGPADRNTSQNAIPDDSQNRPESGEEKATRARRVSETLVPVPTPAPAVDDVLPSREDGVNEPAPATSEPKTSRQVQKLIEPQAPSTEGSTPTPKPRTRKAAAAAAATLATTTTSTSTPASGAETNESDSAEPKTRQGKSTRSSEDSTQKAPRKRKTGTQAGEAQPRKRRARSLTPEDAEAQVVDLQKLTMSDLTKDLHIGKKFSRHDELRERERQARLKARLNKDKNDEESTEEPREGSGTPVADQRSPGAKSAPTASPAPAPPAASAAAGGPQFRVVDGQIVIDQNSLVMDRHARAAAAQAGQDMETIEENDFTRLITSNSFMNSSKLKGPNFWTDPETELFYRGLRMFGTDFEIISKMFPGKNRRHIKLKFNREERHRPRRVDAALIGEKTIKIDLDEYKTFTGSNFEPVETIEAEHAKIKEGFEAEQKRISDENAEAMRKKREELFADEDGNGEDGVKKKKKGAKKKGKEAVAYGLNGEPIPASS